MVHAVNSLNGYNRYDKVICKKSLRNPHNKTVGDKFYLFYKNKTYTIETFDSSDDSAWIMYGPDVQNDGEWFWFKSAKKINFPYFYDYFYTPQEVRLQKLKKICQHQI